MAVIPPPDCYTRAGLSSVRLNIGTGPDGPVRAHPSPIRDQNDMPSRQFYTETAGMGEGK